MALTSCWAQSQGGWGRGGDPLIWMICQESRQNFKQQLNPGPLTTGYVKLCLESIIICHLIHGNGVTQNHSCMHACISHRSTEERLIQMHTQSKFPGTSAPHAEPAQWGHLSPLPVFHGHSSNLTISSVVLEARSLSLSLNLRFAFTWELVEGEECCGSQKYPALSGPLPPHISPLLPIAFLFLLITFLFLVFSILLLLKVDFFFRHYILIIVFPPLPSKSIPFVSLLENIQVSKER